MESNSIDPTGLERSCTHAPARALGDLGAGLRDWVRIAPDPADSGLQRIEARFGGPAYAPHRHDTYAFGLTLSGVQSFRYRGAMRHSLAGNSIVLHPDELHDGEAGVAEGFRYRMVYVDPAAIRDALEDPSRPLPFLPQCVSDDPRLAAALTPAVRDMGQPLDPLEWTGLVAELAETLSTLDPAQPSRRRAPPDCKAVRRAKQAMLESLDAETAGNKIAAQEQTLSLDGLEAVTGQSRFALSRHFRAVTGTSPHRWLIQQKLRRALTAILDGTPLAEVAADTGFADQAHLTRHFKAAYGMTPGAWRDRAAQT